jgi:hypothetical protein
MAIALTKFEIYISMDDFYNQAVATFLQALYVLNIPIVFVGVYDYNQQKQYQEYAGILTSAQATSALAALVTLNTALGHTVTCLTYPVTSQP